MTLIRTAPGPQRHLSFDALRRAVDVRLAELLPEDDGPAAGLNRAMRYVLLAPGKRLRPILTVLASWELGVPGLAALDAACALEMVHAASLSLDDLPCMDDATMRRSRPAAHKAFGEDVAILASIALLGRAIEVASSSRRQPPAARAGLAIILARVLGQSGLSGGQYEDLHHCRPGKDAASVARANHLKTGVLFCAAVDLASTVAAAEAAEADRMRRFAGSLGQAFQILDDLLDGDASLEAAGKDVGQDGGKATLVAVLGRSEASRRLHGHCREALACLSLRPDSSGPLQAFVETVFGAHVEKALV